jgi:hypothetical protein
LREIDYVYIQLFGHTESSSPVTSSLAAVQNLQPPDPLAPTSMTAAAAPIPLILKDKPEYSTPTGKGGPRNGQYSELDPAFAEVKAGADAAVAGLWDASDWTAFRALWAAQAPLPDDCPQPGKDVSEEYRVFPARDGADVGLKIMRPTGRPKGADMLVLRIHGGGWAIGGHDTERVENFRAAGTDGVVLVSVDYRMYDSMSVY